MSNYSLIYVGNEDYCPSCRVHSPIIRELAAELGLEVTWLDTDEHMTEIAPWGIESLPTTIVLTAGLEVGRIVGAYPKNKTLEKLLGLLS